MKNTLLMILIVGMLVCLGSHANRVNAAYPPPSEAQRVHEQLIWQESTEAGNKANHFYAIGDDKSAEEWALKAINAAPMTVDGSRQATDWRDQQLLAKIYLKQGKNAEVVKLYEGKDLSQAFPQDLIILGLANVRSGNYNTALKYYNDKQLADISFKDVAADFPGIDTPKRLEASLLLTLVQSRPGQRVENQAVLEQAHELLPDNPLIAFWYGQKLYTNWDETHKNNAHLIAESLRLLNLAAKDGHGAVRKGAKEELEKIKAVQKKDAEDAAERAARRAAQRAGSTTPLAK
jgi:tetratricopeptide (TPR) repeat protein